MRRTWALVMDGVRARILRGLDDGALAPDPPTELLSRSRQDHLGETMSEPASLVTARPRACRRLAIERRNAAVRRDTEDFARYVGDFLDSHRLAGDFECLAVIAVPPVLATLRGAVSPTLRETIFMECGSDLMRLDESDLRRTVRALIYAMRRREMA